MAQNRASVMGKLVDSISNAPMEFATVAILNLKDTSASLVSYTLTSAKGEFALHNLPAGIPLRVLITFASYKPYRHNFVLTKGQSIDLGTIGLSAKQLHEVMVNAERIPVVIKGDTIEFNAEAFKTRPNAVVEELLKKLPGIEVSHDGTITVMGKNVSKITIDGKDFFANDPKIASKNLDADLVDKVQVYDDRENDPDHLIEDSKVNKIINLKFKKALKKSIFGKVYAGAGTQNRFESGGLFNFFRDTLQFSIIGVGNNLSQTGFSSEELNAQGGFNRSGQGSLNTNSTFGGSNNGGTQNVGSGGININDDIGKKLKLNLLYFFSHTENYNNQILSTQSFLPPDTVRHIAPDTILSNWNSHNTYNANKHTIGGLVNWTPNRKLQIKYTPTLSFTANASESGSNGNSNSNLNGKLSNSSGHNNSDGHNLLFQHTFYFYHRLHKRQESITLSHNLTFNPGNNNYYGTSNSTSYTTAVPSAYLDRYSAAPTKSFDASFTASYRYPFTQKFIADVNLYYDYNYNENKNSIYNYNPTSTQYDVFIDTLSTNLSRQMQTEHLKYGITYNITKKITWVASLNTQWVQVNNQFNDNIPNLNQNYLYWLPNARLTLGNVSITYDASVNQPYIGNLLPRKISPSPTYSYAGNINLVPEWRNNLSLGYNKYFVASQINFSTSVFATFYQNSSIRANYTNQYNVSSTTFVNQSGQHSYSGNINFGKSFKKNGQWKFGTSIHTNINNFHSYFDVNNVIGVQDSWYAGINPSLNINWNDLIEIDPSYNLQRNITLYKGGNYNNVSYTTHNFDTQYSFYLPQKINIEGNYTYTYNPLVSAGYQKSINLFNVSIAHQLLYKDRGEIKISAYDILNQNISSYRYVSGNSITDTEQLILKRYFMLTLQYKFNKAYTSK